MYYCFDSDFDDENGYGSSLFWYNPNEFDINTAETQRISQDIIKDLADLHRKLDKFPFCHGRYIVLPNVNYRGPHSILRQGFHASITERCPV